MDVRELRNCFGQFATGVTVVTFFGDDGQRCGITVNSFTSVSLDPPLVLVSIDRKTNAYHALKERAFVINILSKSQKSLAWQFAGRKQPGLTIDWENTSIGPKLKGALATIECEPWEEYDGGDHVLYVGKVQNFSYNQGEGLMFFQGKFLRTEGIETAVKEQA
ncbi:flavin reductase (DIM6/NTAB) family NADH-FMN oxidoreductase RutF [Scopulibacillus darangshiensis]|uniref:Flavin reductase (DIM6/NTAB) family NADH-FMN oxidoreductase RutF n=1 Tax=Scopulibacillus darangshiensis TaxID=442528 RepID=A0A4R2P4C6_9BACL|nr:flavin reductase family protein [Scopulibacillus darangshiensis]TCP28998.1 flavin reductase (DIM6/NTAB) family NADH-FMN oxidoreductase RutF [Scopulibacillus darangshiensis]